MTFDTTFFLVGIPAMILLGLGKGGFGGASMLAVPILAFVLPPLQAAAVVLPILLVQDVLTIWNFRRDIDRTTLGYLIPASIVGQALAWLMANLVHDSVLRFAIGLTAVVFAIVLVVDRRRRTAQQSSSAEMALKPHSHVMGGIFGGLAGFASFLVHAGSPPYNVYALPRLKTPVLFAGTAAVFFSFQNVIKLPTYTHLGLFSLENLKISLVLLPFAVVANIAGIWLIRRINPKPFFYVIVGLTLLAGSKLIWDALVGRA
jgi:uncharacterized membrane protein YfcA